MPKNKKLLEEIKLALSTMPEDFQDEEIQELQPDGASKETQPVVNLVKEPRVGIYCHGKECKKSTPDVDLIVVECKGKVADKTRKQVKAKCQICGKNKSGFKPKD
jgi:hypothetical protein